MENLSEELQEIVAELRQEFDEKYAKLEITNKELREEVKALERYVQALRSDIDDNKELDDERGEVMTMAISGIEDSLVCQYRATENALSNIQYIENYLVTLSHTIPAPGYGPFGNVFGNSNTNRTNTPFASVHNAPRQYAQQQAPMQNVDKPNMPHPTQIGSYAEYLESLRKAGINTGGFQASPSNYPDDNHTTRYH